MPSPPLGSLRALLRYPVKSMAGEALTSVAVLAEHGLQGDRAYGVLDRETGRIASAKQARRWSALLGFRARFTGGLADGRHHGPLAIALPDGTSVSSDDVDLDRSLSQAFGRPVRLTAAPPAGQAEYRAESEDGDDKPMGVGAAPGTFFDFAPIHLVTTASLAHLRALQPASRFDAARFRPNLVIDTGDARGFVDNDWVGRTLAIGDEVQLCVTFPCPRCVMTTLAQDDLPADPDVLRTAARHNTQWFALLARSMPVVGAYATVVRGGTLRLGDRVRLLGRAPLRRASAVLHAVKRAVRRG
ncbi:MOSC domain-containing protein [Nannocystis pusilla]|uniref:MOSC domain-containing protein n=1 Tax=Nannocystis pusilla TaxID=889268 RepID=A0ABS7TLK7_9BACT|nr:MOSC domain-containing protein [Nannocystis pusilla]MBZ5709108.1 MOSC domain-containing protein [Nannocystis pusilla]